MDSLFAGVMAGLLFLGGVFGTTGAHGAGFDSNNTDVTKKDSSVVEINVNQLNQRLQEIKTTGKAPKELEDDFRLGCIGHGYKFENGKCEIGSLTALEFTQFAFGKPGSYVYKCGE